MNIGWIRVSLGSWTERLGTIFTCQKVPKGHQERSKVSKWVKEDLYFTCVKGPNMANMGSLVKFDKHNHWIFFYINPLSPAKKSKQVLD